MTWNHLVSNTYAKLCTFSEIPGGRESCFSGKKIGPCLQLGLHPTDVSYPAFAHSSSIFDLDLSSTVLSF